MCPDPLINHCGARSSTVRGKCAAVKRQLEVRESPVDAVLDPVFSLCCILHSGSSYQPQWNMQQQRVYAVKKQLELLESDTC